MPEVTLTAEVRNDRGSAPARRIRETGRIPAVLYGHDATPVAISLDARELRHAFSSDAGVNALFDLAVDGKHHLAIARELQRHPVRQTLSHVDFQVVSRDELVSAAVAVHLVGEALATTRAGGSVEHLVQSLHVRAKPSDIPVAFEVDISDLEIGDTIRVGQIVVPNGVTIELDPEVSIAIAHPPRAVVDEVTEAEPTTEEAAAAEESPDSN